MVVIFGGSRISGKGVHMFKGVCVCVWGGGRFAVFKFYLRKDGDISTGKLV